MHPCEQDVPVTHGTRGWVQGGGMDAADFEDVLATVADYVEREVRPAEDEIEETDAIPDRLREGARAMGLFGYALPEEHGGLGLDLHEEVRLAMVLGRTTSAFRSMVATNNGIAGQVLVAFGTPAQQERYLPRLAAGEITACFALTEEGAGSDPSGMRTTARREGDGYVLDGTKRFITNAPQADLVVVFARTGTLEEGTRGISAFAVERDTPGLSVGPKDTKMGQRGAHTAEVVLDGCRVGPEALVGGVEGKGFAAAMGSLVKGRLHIAGMCVGTADRLVEESVAYAAMTQQGGAPIARFQQVQAMLADMRTEAYAGRAMVLAAARDFVDGVDTRTAPSMAKLFASEMVGRVADAAVQVHGGSGYIRGVAVERFYRDVRLFRIYEGTSEVQRNIIAKQLLREV